eukprot:gene11043-biopygen29075
MSLPPEPPPIQPPLHYEHETLIQYNLRNKCQKKDWKQEHRGQCVKLQQVFVPPPAGWRGAAAEAGGGGRGGKAAAAAVVIDDDEDGIENPCPICLDNEDDATVDGDLPGMSPNCPTCRAPFSVSEEEDFKLLWKLVHDRSAGRHTPAAQNNLGAMYRIGQGVEQDHVEAVKWYRMAAEAGDAMAQNNLGSMYRNGERVEQDHVEAVKWYRKSAEAGCADAQSNLGTMYHKGKGVEQDHVAAAKWFRKAAEAGYAAAQFNLGNMYDNGKGVEQDHVEAFKWFRKAADAGDANAHCILGLMHIKGRGVEHDFAGALKWLQLAAVQGNEIAPKCLNDMQQANVIPTPPPGTTVTTILLASAKAGKYNNRTGRVVAPAGGAVIKSGRAAVLLDGEAAPISFKVMNLRVDPRAHAGASTTNIDAPMSRSGEPPPPPPPPPHHEHETLIQYNLRNKVCAYCKRPGALLKCEGCRQRSYCNRKCQKKDWKQEHRGQCVKLQQVFVPPPAGWRDAAAEAGGGGGGGKAAASAVVIDDDEDGIENPCPICLDNEDDAIVDGNRPGMCSACGQSYCGACKAGGLASRSPNCPICRAPLIVSEEENFKRYWKLVHDRSPGRHTPVAQYSLGIAYHYGIGVEQDYVEAAKWFQKSAEAGHATAQYTLGNMYDNGKGVEQDYVEAFKLYRKAAEAGYAPAQFNLGTMYATGNGVEQDHVEAVKWYRKAAEAGIAMAQCKLGAMYDTGNGVEQDHVEAVKWFRKAADAGDADAQCNLGSMYINGRGVEHDFPGALKWLQLAAVQGNEIALQTLDLMQQYSTFPTPPPGTAVTTILLASAKAAKYNNKTGRVVAPAGGAVIKSGRAAVLLDGEAAPISFKVMNLRVDP